VPEKKNEKLLVAFTAFWRIFGILRSLDIRADVRHWETRVFFAGTGRTFPEILLTLIKRKFLSAINADIFARADLLSCSVSFLFGQLFHQNFHARQRYI